MLTYGVLFWEFFKIGLFAVGGGMVTIPFLFDLTRKFDWFTAEELTNMIAVSQSTPGPVGVNMATYAGFQAAGVLGRHYSHVWFGAAVYGHCYLDFQTFEALCTESAGLRNYGGNTSGCCSFDFAGRGRTV